MKGSPSLAKRDAHREQIHTAPGDRVYIGGVVIIADERPAHWPAAAPDDHDYGIFLSLEEWLAVRDWMDAHGYEQMPGEGISEWRERTGVVSYFYAQVVEANEPSSDPATKVVV